MNGGGGRVNGQVCGGAVRGRSGAVSGTGRVGRCSSPGTCLASRTFGVLGPGRGPAWPNRRLSGPSCPPDRENFPPISGVGWGPFPMREAGYPGGHGARGRPPGVPPPPLCECRNRPNLEGLRVAGRPGRPRVVGLPAAVAVAVPSSPSLRTRHRTRHCTLLRSGGAWRAGRTAPATGARRWGARGEADGEAVR